MANEAIKNLWNDDESESLSNETFQHLLLEQYKIAVEMADRLNARRSLTNIFFLTLHAIIVGIVGLSLTHSPTIKQIGLLLIPLLGLLTLCYAWWRLAQWYRHQVDAKAQVISGLEQRLPSNASQIVEGKLTRSGHVVNPLSKLEIYLPFTFAILYIFSFSYVVFIS